MLLCYDVTILPSPSAIISFQSQPPTYRTVLSNSNELGSDSPNYFQTALGRQKLDGELCCLGGGTEDGNEQE